MCGPKWYGFLAVLVSNRVGFLYSSLELGVVCKKKLLFSSICALQKALHNAFNISLN